MSANPSLRTFRLFANLRYSSYIQNRCLGQHKFLSPAYRCDEAWNERLSHPPVQAIKPTDFYYDIEKKYRSTSKVFALDSDLFVNKVTSEDIAAYSEEIEEVIKRLRSSPDTVYTLPSTIHAVYRLFLDKNDADMILRIVTAPEKYGMFPDVHILNLLFDHFLTMKNFTACARIATALMLQEEFGPAITQHFALLSCLQWSLCEENAEWVDYHPPPPEPEDEVQVRVAYLSRPFFDDHFDLKEQNVLVGKTLVRASDGVQKDIEINCKILGLTLHQKWADLISILKDIKKSSEQISEVIVHKVESLLNSADDNEFMEEIKYLLNDLKTSNLAEDFDILDNIETDIRRLVNEHQESDIKTLTTNFELWKNLRENEIERTMKEFEKQQLLNEIKEKKKYLEDREETVFFFDNEDKLKIVIADKERHVEEENKKPIHPKYQWKQKKTKRDLDEEYIPPEVYKRRIS